MYARHLAWGYIDHGPVVAFIIWIFTFLNESSFTVRLGPVILMSFLTIFLYSITKKHMDQQFALITSLALIANLMFHTNSIIITPDVPLAFFSILSILFYYLAYFKDERVPKISVAKLPSGLLWPKSSLSASTICSEFSTRREITLSILFILCSRFIPSESAAALCFLIRF